MTTAVETLPNGRVRKNLASQLDRLDGILDGLADALNESVAAAVEKAVGNVITEILTNPAFTDRLRAPVSPTPVVDVDTTDSTTPPPESSPGFLAKVRGAIRVGCRYVQKAARAVLRRAAAVADAARSYVARLLFRGRLWMYAGALVTAGIVAFYAVPRLPLLLTAMAGWLTALVARARVSLRPNQFACMPETR
jgi:hypothetical protein